MSDKLLKILNSHLLKLNFFAGLISSLAFSPIYLIPIFILSISYQLYSIIQSNQKNEVFKIGYFFGFGHFITSLYWIPIGISTYIDEFWWAIPFALIGLPAFLALYIACVALASWKFRKNIFWFIIVFTSFWVIAEIIREVAFTGFPWNSAGYMLLILGSVAQIGDIFGIYGLSSITIYFSSSLGCLLFNRQNKNLIAHCLTALILLLVAYAYGSYKIIDNSYSYDDSISVRMVQPSIKQEAKWSENSLVENLNKNIYLANLDSNFKTLDLIIWAESAITVPKRYNEVYDYINESITNKHAILISGNIHEEFGDGYKLYSSIIGMNNGKTIFNYHKYHLVPFAEYMPGKSFINIKKITHGIIDYSPGKPGQQTTIYIDRLRRHIKFRPFICYESIFPSEMREVDYDVKFFLNITNDSWFGNSSQPYQHLDIARMRSIENGIPLVRVANNGISAIIDCKGNLLNVSKLNEFTNVDGLIPFRGNVTFYAIYGNFTLIILLLFTLLLSKCIKQFLSQY